MDKGFDIRNYNLFDVLNMLNLPYEFHTQHLADLKNKITQLNQPGVSIETYNFYKKTYILANCIHKYREKKREYDMDYFPEIEEDKLLYEDILKIPDFERLQSSDHILELVLKNNDNLKIKINDSLPQEIVEGAKERLKRSSIEPRLSTAVPLAPGSINSIKRQLQIRNLYLNSCYRDETNSHSTSSNFRYVIPSEINNVVSIQLTSIELPDSWYLCNSHSFTINSNVYTIPDGNYTLDGIKTKINSLITTAGSDNDIAFDIDANSFKTTITNSNVSTSYTITFSSNENEKKKSLGWLLGFREMSYSIAASQDVTSEALYNDGSRRYFYFCINDFQNNVNETNSICLQNNLSNKHILTKICIQDTKNFMKSPVGAKRNYNGPIDLKQINVQLLDEFGEIINLNHMDIGFTLQLELLYERDLIV
jgi:hypothetical protein